MVSRRTRVAFWIFRRDHPSRPKAMICCFFSSFKTFAMLREATYPPAAVNVLDDSSESMAAFEVFLYGRFWGFTEALEVSAISFKVPRRKVRGKCFPLWERSFIVSQRSESLAACAVRA